MNQLPGPTLFWRFPIMGEETWAGVNVRHAFASTNGIFHLNRSSHHDTSPPPVPEFTQNQP